MEAAHPGVLASQWIPDDPALWDLGRYSDFLEARKALLADATNALMRELLHGDISVLGGDTPTATPIVPEPTPIGGITSENEERLLEDLSAWTVAQGFARGQIMHEVADDASGLPEAVLDLAWPSGLQAQLSEPVAVLIDESPEVLRVASRHGFRCFTSPDAFRRYVAALGSEATQAAE